MKLNSSSKKYSPVIFSLITLLSGIGFLEAARGADSDTKNSVEAERERQAGESKREESRRRDALRDKCSQTKKDAEQKKAVFFAACRKTINSLGESSDKKALKNSADDSAVLTNCSKLWESCGDTTEKEDSFTEVMGGALGSSIGMSDMSSFLEDDDAKKCSHLTSEKHQEAIDKLERKQKESKEDYQKRVKDNQTEMERRQEKIADAQKKFTEDQQKKSAADRKRKEEDLNKQNAFNEKINQLQASILKTEREILQAQEELKNFVKVRANAVTQYALDLYACETKAETMREEQLKKSPVVGNSGQAQKSIAKRIYNICRNQVLTKREADKTAFESQKALAEDAINRKGKELQTNQKSLSDFQSMYQKSEADKVSDRTAEDQEFLATQRQAFTQTQQMISNATSTQVEGQKNIQEALGEVNASSNKLSLLKKQTVVGTKDKGVDELSAAVVEYQALKAATATCESNLSTEFKSAVPAAEAPAGTSAK